MVHKNEKKVNTKFSLGKGEATRVSTITIEKIFIKKAHLGHYPATNGMYRYLDGFKKNCSIFDPLKTFCVLKIYFIFNHKKSSSVKKSFLIVNGIRKHNELVRQFALKMGYPYVNQHWIGGTGSNWVHLKKQYFLTIFLVWKIFQKNFWHLLDRSTPSLRVRRLYAQGIKESRKIRGDEETPKNGTGAPVGLDKLPSLILFTDPNWSESAFREVIKMKIPIVAFVNANTPDYMLKQITFPIPGNTNSTAFLSWCFNCIVRLKKKQVFQKKNNFF
uniref:Ribosomal protein S2 n=1 Tax=Entransia fimbriata TaxID=130991 RepID=U5YF16_9VIRI|nr:ribosomal protein S2 [Entransia fimbriata]AGZ90307.1 ribosomal protein S2 [Entransia fimbriata]